MMYEGFANVYDHMMNHIPYETWFENLLQYFLLPPLNIWKDKYTNEIDETLV